MSPHQNIDKRSYQKYHIEKVDAIAIEINVTLKMHIEVRLAIYHERHTYSITLYLCARAADEVILVAKRYPFIA